MTRAPTPNQWIGYLDKFAVAAACVACGGAAALRTKPSGFDVISSLGVLAVGYLTVRLKRSGSVVHAMEEQARLRQREVTGQNDELTGLLSRRAMLDALSGSCTGVSRFALLLVDLDRFKVLNDTAGHATGDIVIEKLAKRIRGMVPENAVVARPNGCDEFAIIVPGDSQRKDIDLLCWRLVASARRPLQAQGKTVAVTLSVGAALFPEHGNSPEALITNADLAVQAAKRAGRDTYRLFGAEQQSDLDRLQLERELREAVQKNQFTLFYQPQFCAKSGRLTGLEALIRWNHPSRGLVSLGVFVPLLEETGFIIEVGYWSIPQAIGALHDLDKVGPQCACMSINVSARQFQDSGLAEAIASALKKHDMKGSRVVVEITESTLMESLEHAQAVLAQLRLLGVRIAIDDFGTGYSSLSYLTTFQPRIVNSTNRLLTGLRQTARPGQWSRQSSSWRTNYGLSLWPRAWRPNRNSRFCARRTAMKSRAICWEDRSHTTLSLHSRSSNCPHSEANDMRGLLAPCRRAI
ncbi:putative bifunctional diguanylate cyclase/phosphodiesterase [Paraburkholderia sp. 40]|uniref:putative bifunctional diguanylate cyclase/phosphodiesterase n=1 Tax=Paraburkholderia sp. 40 TaxID=2991059 RepID=UPI003D21EE29